VSEIERLRAQIDGSWSELAGLVEAMSPAERASQDAAGWPVKDHLTHVAGWELSLIGLIEGANRLEAMGLDKDADRSTDSINAALFELHRGKSADESLDYFRLTHQRLMAVLGRMTDLDLELPYSHYQPSAAADVKDLPVLGWVAGNTYDHYAEHTGWIKNSRPEKS